MNKKAYQLMLNSVNIAIFTHTTPDFDGVASSIALKLHLDSLGKKVQLFCDDTLSDYLKNFEKTELVKNALDNTTYDLAIILDCGSVSRIGKFAEVFKNIKNTIAIDHHQNLQKSI